MDTERLEFVCSFIKGMIPIMIYVAKFLIPFFAWFCFLDYILPKYFPRLYNWIAERLDN